MKPKVPPANPEYLRFLGAYDKHIVDLALATRRLVLEEAAGSIELLYDAYSAVSAGYSFTGRPSDTFVYIAAFAKRVNLGFYWGVHLRDPDGRLQGSGRQSRHIPIEEVKDLRKPYVRAFVKAAVKMAERPAAGEALQAEPGASVVRAIYARKRRPVK